MRTWTETHREGTNVGPVDWTHPIAKDAPQIWKDAEKDIGNYQFVSEYGTRRDLVDMCMYDGWPYWEPRPAIAYISPLGGIEWAFFDSYGIGKYSIAKKVQSVKNTEED